MNLKYHLTPAAENCYAYFRPATPSSAGIDLRWIGPEITLLPGESTGLQDIGVALDMSEMPPCVALLLPRSSLGVQGLALRNTAGVIDQDYKDTLKANLENRSQNTPIHILPGQRILQLIVMPVLRPLLTASPVPFAVTRGGFGSTGSV